MAWSAADDAVVAWQDSPEFAEAALAWARENMRCETCKYFDIRTQCSLWISAHSCIDWEPKP